MKYKHKVGDKFKVIREKSNHWYRIGDIVSLLVDDRSRRPLFERKDGLKQYMYYQDLEPHKETRGRKKKVIEALSIKDIQKAFKNVTNIAPKSASVLASPESIWSLHEFEIGELQKRVEKLEKVFCEKCGHIVDPWKER